MSRTKQKSLFIAALCLLSSIAFADNSYMVEKGDSLIKIGKLTGVPYKEIMKANSLTSTVIHPNQILRIPAGGRTSDRDRAASTNIAMAQAPQPVSIPIQEVTAPVKPHVPGYSDVNHQRDQSTMKTAYIPPVQGASKARPSGPQSPKTYTVREGDTLWSISQRFGFDSDDLQKANNIKFSTIQIGQILTLPKKVSIAAN